jgi:hypothetical protein
MNENDVITIVARLTDKAESSWNEGTKESRETAIDLMVEAGDLLFDKLGGVAVNSETESLFARYNHLAEIIIG